jgi:hypothetical protein
MANSAMRIVGFELPSQPVLEDLPVTTLERVKVRLRIPSVALICLFSILLLHRLISRPPRTRFPYPLARCAPFFNTTPYPLHCLLSFLLTSLIALQPPGTEEAVVWILIGDILCDVTNFKSKHAALSFTRVSASAD